MKKRVGKALPSEDFLKFRNGSDDLKTAVRATYDDKAVYFCWKALWNRGTIRKPSTVDLKTLWLVPSAVNPVSGWKRSETSVYSWLSTCMDSSFPSPIPDRPTGKRKSRPRSFRTNGLRKSASPMRRSAESPGKGMSGRFNVGRNFLQRKSIRTRRSRWPTGIVSDYWDLISRTRHRTPLKSASTGKSNSLKVCR